MSPRPSGPSHSTVLAASASSASAGGHGHAVGGKAHRRLGQILGVAREIDSGADHHHRAALVGAADILKQHAGHLLAGEQNVVWPFEQHLRPPLIGDQLGDGVEGDDTRDAGRAGPRPAMGSSARIERLAKRLPCCDTHSRPPRPRPCDWRADQIHNGPGSPASARRLASALVESTVSIRAIGSRSAILAMAVRDSSSKGSLEQRLSCLFGKRDQRRRIDEVEENEQAAHPEHGGKRMRPSARSVRQERQNT